MNTALATLVPVSNNLPTTFLRGMSGSDYLPRLQLVTSKAKAVENGFPANHFAVIEGSDNLTDLGTEVDVILLAVRPIYLDVSGETPLAFHHPMPDEDGTPTCPKCLSIMERSELQDSGCLWGLEFLTWVAGRKQFAVLSLASKSARREADKFLRFMGQGAALCPKKIETKKYTWTIATVRASSTITNLPTPEEMAHQIAKFDEAKDSEVEVAEAATDARKR